MLSIELAQQLKKAGLPWTPRIHDRFLVPDRGLDDTPFVISNMAVLVEVFQGHPVITFHGTPEWALDYVWIADIVWLPHEHQLREAIEYYLVGEESPSLMLLSTRDGYRCELVYQNEELSFEAFSASDVYALALLHLLGVAR